MKHKHCEMIVAKAKNMDLVVFTKDCIAPNNKPWLAIESGHLPAFDEHCEYFLCLPQHNESGQCLHWLNGGETQVIGSEGLWSRVFEFESYPWEEGHCFMDEDAVIRIKPRKEKRWIVTNGKQVKFIDKGLIYPEDCQLIEIEVEV